MTIDDSIGLYWKNMTKKTRAGEKGPPLLNIENSKLQFSDEKEKLWPLWQNTKEVAEILDKHGCIAVTNAAVSALRMTKQPFPFYFRGTIRNSQASLRYDWAPWVPNTTRIEKMTKNEMNMNIHCRHSSLVVWNELQMPTYWWLTCTEHIYMYSHIWPKRAYKA